ncbi:uncharacterized protein C8Q71DRAFT_62614 [Rhodofomes roseus]|uniref:DUF6534 domain-containing protein n=1 Tax=Rhodofomes roseus TaxID=34475 RepID=A0ABQ8KGP8_9APHY|nr:uncharacterized protein C8Q71DRAFT_62614 [Rhodofomes roseus]KAH9836841.1 hypothetical protein C8Q71DRAFT_62614 [Rhodofomes roseus]
MHISEAELNGILGAILLSGTFSWMLYGCTCGQVLYYVNNYASTDHKHIKILVTLVWMLDTGKMIMGTACDWDILVGGRGTPARFEGLPGILPGIMFFGCITIFIVHCCYLYTIWKFLKQSDRLSRWQFIMAPPLLFATGSLVAGLVNAAHVVMTDNIEGALAKNKLVGPMRLACAVITDIYITVWLCYHLQDAKTGQEPSDNMITRLVNYAISRGMFTAIAQILAVVLLLTDGTSKTLYSMIFYVPASGLYVNSLLFMWNVRHYVKKVSMPTNPSRWSNMVLDHAVDSVPKELLSREGSSPPS